MANLDIFPEEIILKLFKNLGLNSAFEAFQRLAMVNKTYNRISRDIRLSLFKVCGRCHARELNRNHIACYRLYRNCNPESLYTYIWENSKHELRITSNIEKYVKSYIDNGFELSNILSYLIVSDANVDSLRYAHENGCPWDEDTCYEAAKNGNLECLKYAHKNGCEMESFVCDLAAENGHLECLKYAYDNGCEIDSSVFSLAAKGGYLECLKYAYENECNWDEDTCNYAAWNGHLDCLKYAYENGCRWNSKIFNNTMKNGHSECFRYILKMCANDLDKGKIHERCISDSEDD